MTPRRRITEAPVVAAVQQVIDVYHLMIWRNNTGAVKTENRFIRFGKKGTSDFLGCSKTGRLIAVECKRPSGGRVTDEQAQFLRDVESRGGVALLCRDVEDFIKTMKEIGEI